MNRDRDETGWDGHVWIWDTLIWGVVRKRNKRMSEKNIRYYTHQEHWPFSAFSAVPNSCCCWSFHLRTERRKNPIKPERQTLPTTRPISSSLLLDCWI